MECRIRKAPKAERMLVRISDIRAVRTTLNVRISDVSAKLGHFIYTIYIYIKWSNLAAKSLDFGHSNMHGQSTERLKSERNSSDLSILAVRTKIATEL